MPHKDCGGDRAASGEPGSPGREPGSPRPHGVGGREVQELLTATLGEPMSLRPAAWGPAASRHSGRSRPRLCSSDPGGAPCVCVCR